MNWFTWKPALALGAVLAVGGAGSADDRDLLRPAGGAPSTTMTLGGRGTAQEAATEDNELARGYHGGYGGHYGYHSGYGYRGGYYGGYRGGYYGGGYGGYYRPAYYGGYYGGYYGSYYRPAYYYAPRPYYPVYPSYYGPSVGFYIGIGGGAASGAPAVNLGGPVPQPMTPPAAPGDGTFRYDGGPANPVPLPKADPQGNTSAPSDLPVSLKPKATTAPYKYKAYGEK